MTISIEKFKNNWETYEKLCKRLSDDSINELLDVLGERLIMCPSSMRADMSGAYPGGMVEHALSVTSMMRQLNDACGMDLTVSSILKVGLLHDIGKVGGLDKDNFIEQDSAWHRDNLGQMYKYNENLERMSVSHRTLYLLQHFGVTLSSEEWVAIQIAQGSHFEENRFYVGHEPSLGIVLQQAKGIVNHSNRNQ